MGDGEVKISRQEEGLPKLAEQRNYKRIAEELPVHIEYDGKNVETTTQNISCGGMFIPPLGNGICEEDSIRALIKLPDSTKVVKLAGVVKRIENNTDNGLQGIAVQFSGLYDSNHHEIDLYVKKKIMN